MNPIGFSTGALALGEFRTALGYLRSKDFSAVELSALRVPELPTLIENLPTLDLRQFSYIALHAPSRFTESEELEIVRLLSEAPFRGNIIVHPDAIHNYKLWLPFGNRLAIENMDRRKPDGRSADELAKWFQYLPEARFCLDLAHAQQWDTTMTETYIFLKLFSQRLCQVHISQLDSASHHFPLSTSSVRAFSELAWLIPSGIPYIIESRIKATEIDAEADKVRQVASSVPIGAYQAIPALVDSK